MIFLVCLEKLFFVHACSVVLISSLDNWDIKIFLDVIGTQEGNYL